jgi:serralysin
MAVFTGTNGNDIFQTTSNNDTVTGLAGNDWIVMYGGTDSINGGTGDDTLSFVFANHGIKLDLRKTAAQNIGFGTATVIEIENVRGSDFADRLLGNTGANTLYGYNGNDYLWGSKGDDYIVGGAGNDKYLGGAGNDIASFQDADVGITIDMHVRTAQFTGEGKDLFRSIEKIFGSQFDDDLVGDANANTLVGGSGDDYLDGGGSFNPDQFDTLTGGDGADIFVINFNGLESTVFSRTYITDFQPGDDILDFTDIEDYGFEDVSQFIIGATTIIRVVAIDSVGQPVTLAEATLNGNFVLNESDFVI